VIVERRRAEGQKGRSAEGQKGRRKVAMRRRIGSGAGARAVLVASLLAGALTAALAGCSTLGPTSADADATVAAFGAALEAGDGVTACALLDEGAVDDVQSQTKADCSDGVLELDLPVAGSPHATEVYGRSALVRAAADSLFLTVAGADWRIRAAGCTPVRDAPFECMIEGG
jgi:hypothetical protein